MAPRRGTPAVPLTEARKRLFQLVEDVLAGRRDRVALSHRAHEETVLLVRASEIERMEAELAALRRRSAVAEPRPLWGIATIVGDPETIVEENRARQNALYEAKMRAIFGEPAPETVAESRPEAPRTSTRRRSTRDRKPAP